MDISRRIGISCAAMVVVVFLGLAFPAFAGDGDLDTTFGHNGKVTTSVSPGPSEANAVAVESDGKIVAVGTDDLFERDPSRFAVVRYNADGSLDTSFGGDGIVTTNITRQNDHAFGVAIQPDDKIVVVGYSGAGAGSEGVELTVVRYDSDGSLDPTFGTGGTVRTEIGH